MPSTLRKEFSSNTGSGTVVPLRTPDKEPSRLRSDAEFWSQILKDAIPEDLIKSSIENAISEHFVQRLTEGSIDDNPFDAIYFAELGPDAIVRQDIALIRSLSSITDLSDTVEIDDGWDD